VRRVAVRAESVARQLDVDFDVLVSSAWLHDLGYGPAISDTGFHPLDGARFLRDDGWHAQICSLVAHHSAALTEAKLRGLSETLSIEFAEPDAVLSDALWYADMTVGPDGLGLTVEQRLDEIAHRHGPEALVTRATKLSAQDLIGAVRRTEERLQLAGAVKP